MRLQFRSIQISLLIHAAVIAMIVAASYRLSAVTHPVSISFDVDRTEEGAASATPKVQRRPEVQRPADSPRIAAVKPAPLKEPEKVIEALKQKAPASTEAILPVSAPAKAETAAVATISSAASGAGSGESGSGTGGMSAESAGSKYRKEHLAFIQKKIDKNKVYPPIALRNGWQGAVVVTFFILTDGSIDHATTEKSSGIWMLDRDAVQTVERSAPFPKPTVNLQMSIRLVYSINES